MPNVAAHHQRPRLLGFCAQASGSGKTTLLTALIPVLIARGLRISVIKHAHHQFDIDHPGKDSYRLREAGAVQTLVGSSRRWALITELERSGKPEPELFDLVDHIDPTMCDLVLVEGFKLANIPKIEIHRPSLGHPLLADQDHSIIAIASDVPFEHTLRVLDLNQPAEIADYIRLWLSTTPH